MAVYIYPYTILHSKQSTTFFNLLWHSMEKIYSNLSKIWFLDTFDINSSNSYTGPVANFEYVVSNLGSVFGRRFM